MIIESPQNPNVTAQVDETFRALRTSIRPIEYRANGLYGGHFRLAMETGLTTVLNTGDPIFSLRYNPTVFRFALLKLQVSATIRTVFGAAQEVSVDLVKVQGFTTADAGGNVVTVANTGIIAPGMAMSALGATSLRVASATAVTFTNAPEANPIGHAALAVGNVAGSSAKDTLYDFAQNGGHPLILDSQQGIRARIGLTQGAAGVVVYRFIMDWAELPATGVGF